MNVFVESILTAWERNNQYGQKLVADLSDEQMAVQPAPNMNHPAWVLSHLNAYHGVLHALLREEAFDDPLNHPFGMKSKPAADRALYASKEALVAAWTQGHGRVADAMRAADEALFEKLMPLERWRKPFPKIGSVLGYVMIAHENVHLGQLSAWRRVQGLSSV